MSRHHRPRVVVTGLGAVSPIGNTVAQFWEHLCTGVSGVAIATRYDPTDMPYVITAEVKDFDPTQHMDPKTAKRTARFVQLALAAAGEAITNSGLALDQIDRTRVGVVIGTSLGGTAEVEEQTLRFEAKQRKRVEPLYLPTFIYNMASCHVAMAYDFHGPNTTPVMACATGSYAIGAAFRMIQAGDATVVVAGGSDAGVTALNSMAFGVIGAIAPAGDDPSRAVRPFDAERRGTAGGEGCGVLILEELEHALARGATIYAEIVGFGATEDAFHLTAPAPDGRYAALAMQRALADAQLAPTMVDHISAHGTATSMGDAAETAAIHTAFGAHAPHIAVSGIKSMIGHTAGAAGALAAVGVVKSIVHQVVPPTMGYATPDPACDLDYVPNVARAMPVRAAMVNAFGFGGQNAVVLFAQYQA
jgi:3-oxoacyl-[acyl-carrier-protein] synthase II